MVSAVATDSAPLHPRIRELLGYIDAHRRALLEAAASVPAELRGQRPEADSWSVAEVLEHLSIIEKRVAGMLSIHVAAAREKGVGPDEETSSVVASYPRSEAVLDRTKRIVAVKSVVPTGTLDANAATQSLAQSREAMVSALRNANGVSLEHLMQAHPVLGELNLYHWIVALGLHEDRHAAQIREIGQALATH
jgi:DinB family protein